MSDLTSSYGGDFVGHPDEGRRFSPPKRDDVIESVKQQVAMANVETLLSKMSEKCFQKCINNPGSSLAGSEQRCVFHCMDRYLESWNVISKVYQSRIQREHESR